MGSKVGYAREDIIIHHVHGTPWEPFMLSTCVSIYLKVFLLLGKMRGKMRFEFFLLLYSSRIGALVPTYHLSGDEKSELRSVE